MKNKNITKKKPKVKISKNKENAVHEYECLTRLLHFAAVRLAKVINEEDSLDGRLAVAVNCRIEYVPYFK